MLGCCSIQRSHTTEAIQGGFIQSNHGKEAPLSAYDRRGLGNMLLFKINVCR